MINHRIEKKQKKTIAHDNVTKQWLLITVYLFLFSLTMKGKHPLPWTLSEYNVRQKAIIDMKMLWPATVIESLCRLALFTVLYICLNAAFHSWYNRVEKVCWEKKNHQNSHCKSISCHLGPWFLIQSLALMKMCFSTTVCHTSLRGRYTAWCNMSQM